MKVRASARRMCKMCRFIRRKNGKGKKVIRVICQDPKHKQRQG